MAGGGYEDRKKAQDDLAVLAENPKDPVVRLLSVHLLDKSAEKNDALVKLTDEVCSFLRRKYTRETWKETVSRAKNSLIVLILSKLLDEAEKWLFEEKNNDGRI
jgi:hypothetical protein